QTVACLWQTRQLGNQRRLGLTFRHQQEDHMTRRLETRGEQERCIITIKAITRDFRTITIRFKEAGDDRHASPRRAIRLNECPLQPSTPLLATSETPNLVTRRTTGRLDLLRT